MNRHNSYRTATLNTQRVVIKDGRIAVPTQGRVCLWTIVAPMVWSSLCSAGTLYIASTRILYQDFLPQYDWLRGQMAQRVPGYHGHYPWWAWALPKPDLRDTCYHYAPRGYPLIRLGVAVPVDEVLCMDYDAWHMPLNNGYLSLDEADDAAWEALPDADRTHEAMERSWERLFDHNALFDPEWFGSATRIQAIFETLRLADVVDVTRFCSRASAKVNWHPDVLARYQEQDVPTQTVTP